MTYKFGQYWMNQFVERQKVVLKHRVPRPVGHDRFVTFNAFTMETCFAQAQPLYQKHNIVRKEQVFNLDQTGFSSGQDISDANTPPVIAPAEQCAVIPRCSFGYTDRVPILLCVNDGGIVFAPKAGFRGVQEPSLSAGPVKTKVSDLVGPERKAFWRPKKANVNTKIFFEWVDVFISAARANIKEDEWIVLLYDALRLHMTGSVIERLVKRKIAVIALPAHTSDRVQPLDVSVFGQMKQYTNKSLSKMALDAQKKISGQYKLNGLNIWAAIMDAFKQSVKKENSASGFAKSGLWPLNPQILCESRIRELAKCQKTLTLAQFQRELQQSIVELNRFGPP